MRIGVFGGAFDPVHFGHLTLAEECRRQAHLDQVWFLPSAVHPFKAGKTVTPFEHRTAMLRLAIHDRPEFAVCDIERELPPPNYTADTLGELGWRHPGAEWFFLVGSDALAELPLWHDPPRIVRQATLVVMARPDYPILSTEELRDRLKLSSDAPLTLVVVDVPPIPISSREIRRRVAAGESIDAMVPKAVCDYIAAHCLYRTL